MTIRHLMRVMTLMLLVAALDPRAGARGQDAGGGRATLVVINQEDSTIGFHDAGSGERIGLARTGMRPHEAVLSAEARLPMSPCTGPASTETTRGRTTRLPSSLSQDHA